MKSSILVIVLFPLVLPIWKEKPLTKENSRRPELPSFLTDQEISSQIKLFKKLVDPRIRSGVPQTLSCSNNAYAVRGLESLLAFEKNQFVLADILRAIHNFKGRAPINKTPLYKNLLDHSNDEVRALAAALYFDKTGASSALTKVLEREDSQYVLNFLGDELSDQAWRFNRTALKSLINEGSPNQKAVAVYLLAQGKTDPDSLSELKDIAENGDEASRLSLCAALAQREKGGGDALAHTLAKDKRVAIRTLTASLPATKTRESLFLSLAQDEDWEVRRLACLSLGSYPTEKTISTLLKKLEDPSEPVRVAAEESLISIKPGQSTIERLKRLLNHPVAFDSAVRILGALGVVDSAESIHAILKKARRTKTKKRCVDALGELNHKAAWQTISEFAEDESADVRKSVATALGSFAEAESFPTIVKLIGDNQLGVSLEAIRVAGQIADPYFNDCLYKVSKNVAAGGHPDKRAAACWALARINQPNKKILKWLQALCLKRVIPMEGERMFDDDHVRTSACLALVEMGKQNNDIMTTAEKIATQLKNPPMFNPDFNNPTLRDYARQAFLYLKGKEIKPMQVSSEKPLFIVKPIVKKGPNYRTSGRGVPGI